MSDNPQKVGVYGDDSAKSTTGNTHAGASANTTHTGATHTGTTAGNTVHAATHAASSHTSWWVIGVVVLLVILALLFLL